jgi:PAT family beta-lactamase induction signal transducer AmpG
MLAIVFVLMLALTWRSPEPDMQPAPPPTLRDAVWLPLMGMLRRPRALEILAFVLLYKLGDQLTQSLTRPFLIDMGYDAFDRGIALTTLSVGLTILGTFARWARHHRGGPWSRALDIRRRADLLERRLPLARRAGSAQRRGDVRRHRFRGLRRGAGDGRVWRTAVASDGKAVLGHAIRALLQPVCRAARLAGPLTGFTVSALGWPSFFLLTMALGVPGLVMLARFVPIGVREPDL